MDDLFSGSAPNSRIILPNGNVLQANDHDVSVWQTNTMAGTKMVDDNRHITLVVDGSVVAYMVTWRLEEGPTLILSECRRNACSCRLIAPLIYETLAASGVGIPDDLRERYAA